MAVVRAPGFTGRGRELAELTSALAVPPAVVLIEGEAGIGKSRLVAEYLATADRRALVARCPPFRQPQTLGPVADGLRQAVSELHGLGLSGLAGALRPLFPEWADHLPPAPDPAGDAGAARHRLFAALAELIGCLGVDLLVTEDVHWADDATLEFLLFLATRQSRPVCMAVTCRPEDVPAGSLLPRLARLAAGASGVRLELGALGVGDTAGLVSSMLGGERLSEEFAGFVHEHTGGVPLAAEESVRLLAARADLVRRDGQWVRRELGTLAVPPPVRDAVLERASRLDPDARAVLWAAAVLAAPAGEAILQSMTELSAERLRGVLAQILDRGLLGDDAHGLISFRHALAAQAVYESIPGPHRRLLHQRAGEALETLTPPPAARLARHFREAGDTARWSQYAGQAADLALAAGDEAAANTLLCELLTAADLPAAEVARLTAKIPSTSFTGPDRTKGLLSVLRRTLDAAGLQPLEEGSLRFQAGRLLAAMEDYDASAGELEHAVQKLPPGSPDAPRAMIRLGWPLGNSWPASRHRMWLRRAAEAPSPPDPAERLGLAVDRVTALLLLGDQEGWAEAAQLPGDAPTVAERRQVARGQLNIGHMAMLWGRYGEARQRLARGRELAGAGHYLRTRTNIMVTGLHLDWLTGTWDGLAGRAASLAAQHELQPVMRLETILVAGLLDAAAGSRAHAEERLRLVCAQARRHGSIEFVTESAAGLARLMLADGRVGDALQVTTEPAAIVAGKDTWIWAGDLAPARAAGLAADGQLDEAASLVDAFARGLRGRHAPAPKAGLVLCRAILAEARGEHARAAALFARMAAACQALPRPYDALLARERQARCLLASEQAGAATVLLTDVFRGLCDLGARGDAERLMPLLRQQGIRVRPPWWGGRRSYGDRLSPRELDVVRLLAAGHSDREIAQELFLSRKTVTCHVDAAMRKLNVTSRVALGVRAVSTGLVSAEQSAPAG